MKTESAIYHAKILNLLMFIYLFTISCTASQYKLGPGDQLQITVWGHPDLSLAAVVRPDGVISFPLLGDCQAANLTPQELAERLEEQLAAYIKRPQVTISVLQFRQIQVQVLGEVARPGQYSLLADSTISQALSAAGGVLPQRAASKVTLTRRGGQKFTFDLASLQTEDLLLADGDLLFIPTKPQVTVLGEVSRPGLYLVDQGTRLTELLAQAGGLTQQADPGQGYLLRGSNRLDLTEEHFSGSITLELEDQDTLYIPSMPQIVVRGEVARPGTYRLPVGTTIYTALAQAGDLTDKADPKQIILFRNGESQRLDLTAGGGEVRLRANDLLEIPQGRREVLVLGQVRSPGAYLLPPDSSVLDAIARAGGTTERANTEQIRLYAKGDFEAEQVLALGTDRLLFEGKLSANPRLGEGDIVFVPESRRIDWGKLATVLGVFQILREIFLGE